MGDIIDASDIGPYSQDIVYGLGVVGPPAQEIVETQPEAVNESVNTESIEEDVGRHVDVRV